MLRAFWSMISKNSLFRPNNVKILRVPPLRFFYPWGGGAFEKHPVCESKDTPQWGAPTPCGENLCFHCRGNWQNVLITQDYVLLCLFILANQFDLYFHIFYFIFSLPYNVQSFASFCQLGNSMGLSTFMRWVECCCQQLLGLDHSCQLRTIWFRLIFVGYF